MVLTRPCTPQHGANVNAQMYSGSSALHSASGRGLLPLVRTLVRSGADSSLKNCHNDTPLMVARSRRVSVQGGGVRGWGSLSQVWVRRTDPGVRVCVCAHAWRGEGECEV